MDHPPQLITVATVELKFKNSINKKEWLLGLEKNFSFFQITAGFS
jgi:hypothetical protein